MNFPDGTTEHPINRSGKRKILVSVWDFGAVHPQSERLYYLCNDHPAKMRPCLAKAILQIYAEPPVLDPMAGVGTTLVEAILLGMNAVGVEFEQKFVDQANRNIEHVRKLFPNKNLGKSICIKGDARDLSCLNDQKINSVIFSPPYFNAIKKGDEGPYARSRRINHRRRIKRFQGYSGNKNNIGNAQNYGDGFFGSIVFSPPYCGVMDAKRHVGGIAARDASLAKTGLYSEDESNLGNIRAYGEKFGSIIFSPPYADVIRGNKEGPMATSMPSGWKNRRVRIDEGYSKDPSNIGNTKYGGTYLGEMFKVYSECFRVLKENKFMVVVVKDIRRKGLTIPLGADTIKLCQMVGFELFDIIVNKMYFPSFWQLTHAQKTQAKGIPMTLRTHEYFLVFKKAPNSSGKGIFRNK